MKTARGMGMMMVLWAAVGGVSNTWAQGSLTPPGPPGPMMKTLQEVEPRTAITSLPCTITQRGSYYLATNLTGIAGTNGISIAADDVTLDLNGFALIGIPGSNHGIEVMGTYESHLRNVAIRNGTVRNWGGQGIKAWYADHSQFEQLRVATNQFIGLSCGQGCVVTRCTAAMNASSGMYIEQGSLVDECAAMRNQTGIQLFNGNSTLRGCTVVANTAAGIDASDSLIQDCSVVQNGSYGIYATFRATITGCRVAQNQSDGIYIQMLCRVENNTCVENGYTGVGSGIRATSDDNMIVGNTLTRNDYGINLASGGNFIVHNVASGNGTNYAVTGTQTIGPIVTATGTITNTNPWANFEF